MILGADVFDAHAAVIDYATESLFLKAVAAERGAAPDPARNMGSGNSYLPV